MGNIKRKIAGIIATMVAVILACMVALPSGAFAFDNDLTIKWADGSTPIANATFRLYKIGSMNGTTAQLDPEYVDYGVTIDFADRSSYPAAVLAFDGYIKRDNKPYASIAQTNEQGIAQITFPDTGVYLLNGDTTTVGNRKYTPSSQLVIIPSLTAYDSMIEPKFSFEEIPDEPNVPTPEPVKLSVVKSWKNDTETDRPDSVEVQLLCDGEVIDEVALDASVAWRFTWEELEAGHDYQVIEKVTTSGYTNSIVYNEGSFILTNTKKPNIPLDDEPTPAGTPDKPQPTPPATSTDQKIPQTGTQWMFIALIGGAGILFLLSYPALRRAVKAGRELGKTKTAVLCVGTALVLVAGGLSSYAMLNEESANDAAASVSASLKDAIDKPKETPDYRLADGIELPVKDIDGIACVGQLEFPSLDLTLPVSSECTLDTMSKTPGRLCGTPYKKNMVLGAHNYSRHFGQIKNLQQGDDIYFTDMDGNRFHYKAYQQEILNPEEYDRLVADNANYDLSLFTCTPSGSQRVVIRCCDGEGR